MTYSVHGLLRQEQRARATIRALLADPRIAYIHAHNSANGCFAARIERN